MPNPSLIDSVKMALRVTGSEFDDEITILIHAGKAELHMLGITDLTDTDPLFRMAVVTYCRIHFGEPSDFERLKRIYDEQKAQLMTAYTYRGGDSNG